MKKNKNNNHLTIPNPLSLELGKDLLPLVGFFKRSDFLKRVSRMRQGITNDLGIEIPKIRIIDNMRLGSSEYCIKIHGVEMGKSIIKLGCCLCINPGTVKKEVSGEKIKEPAFGTPALWISKNKWDMAAQFGYTVADHTSIILTHFSEIIKQHAAELLDRQKTQAIIENLRKDYPIVVDEVFTGHDGKNVTLGQLKKILQGLLKEQVSIRNIVSIMESIADYQHLNNDTRFFIEMIRQTLSSQLCHQFADKNRTLNVLTLDNSLEKNIFESKVLNRFGDYYSALEPTLHKALIKALAISVKTAKDKGYNPVILCTDKVRYLMKNSLEREFPGIAVLSISEIARSYTIKSVGVISLEQEKM